MKIRKRLFKDEEGVTPYYDYFVAICKSKRGATKPLLEGTFSRIEKRYTEYFEYFIRDILQNVVKSFGYSDQEKEALQKCYGSTKQFNDLKSKIYSNDSIQLNGVCPYCNIGKPTTIDHYLPQTDFSEYAVMALNLFPCCSECNNLKLNYWKDSSDESSPVLGIINFYYNDFSSNKFLYLDVDFSHALPKYHYYLDSKNLSSRKLFATVTLHFKRLKILSRYKDETHVEISELLRQFRIHAIGKPKRNIKWLILEDAKSLADTYGINYWKSVLRDEIANNQRFLDFFYDRLNSIELVNHK